MIRLTVAMTGVLVFVAGCGDGAGPVVVQPQIARVEVTPPSLNLVVGAQQKLTATVFNTAGATVANAQITWSTGAPAVATVGADGTVSAVGPGTAQITAAAGGKQASTGVTVTGQVIPPAQGTITLNPAVRFQTMSGWEADAQAGQEDPTFPAYKNRLFDAAANDLGINRLRLEVRSGTENSVDYYTQWLKGQIDDATWRCVRYATVNDNSDPNTINPAGFQFSQLDSTVEHVVIPMQQRLAARGERLFINLNYVAFTAQICTGYQYNHNVPAEYAEMILATTEHLKSKYGITPDAWEVILEPDNTTYWRGNTIGSSIVATAARLSAAGYTPRFIAPSTTRSYNAVPYFDAMLQAVPAAKQFMLELAYHRYSSVTTTELQTIAARASANGIGSSMLEHIASPYTDLHSDLKLANVSAWQQYTLAYPGTPGADDGSKYYIVDKTNAANPTITLASRTKYLRQYFKFIRAGAVRIDATSGNTALDPVAFINTNGNYVVVVKATAAATFTVGGLPAGTYGIKYTTSTAYDVDLADVVLPAGQALSTNIPAAGVLTVYRK